VLNKKTERRKQKLPSPSIFLFIYFLLALVPSASKLQQKKEKKEGDVARVAFFNVKKKEEAMEALPLPFLLHENRKKKR